MIRYVATAVIWSMALTTAFAHLGPIIEVPKLVSKPKIDRDLSDWQTHAWTNGVWDFDRYDCAVSAMLENGVQVYFVESSTFEQMRTAQDHGLAALRSAMSENQRRNINVVPLVDP